MLKRILIAVLFAPLLALAQSYPSPTFNNLTVQGTFTATGKVGLASLATQAANTVVANVTGSSASPTAFAMPSCSATGNALNYTSGTGWTCATGYALLASPAFTGTPTAPTAAAGTNTTQAATTAFVVNHAPCPSILDNGGDNTNTSNNDTALTNTLAKGPVGQSCAYFPPGTYKFASQDVFTMANTTAQISLYGAGTEQTILTWASGGGIKINYLGAFNGAHIRDMTLTTGTTATGIAILLNQTNASIPNPGNSALTDITNVIIRGSDGQAQTDYWAGGVQAVGVSNINFTGLGVFGNGTSAYSTFGTGVNISGSSAVPAVVYNFTGVTLNALNVGINYGTWVQGMTVVGSNFTGDSIGIAVSASLTGLDQLAITTSQFNAVTGVNLLTGLENTQITNSLFIIPNNGAGINAQIASLLQVTGNTFEPSALTGVSGQTGIAVNNVSGIGGSIVGNAFFNLFGTAINLSASSNTMVVHSNIFGSNTVSNVSNSGTANQVGGSLISKKLITTTGTYTATLGTAYIEEECVGGGGAGGGTPATSSAQNSVGGSGGSGAWEKGIFTSGFSGVTVTIGAAGAAASGAAGGNGGQTSFGALATAPGGAGGSVGALTTGGVAQTLGGNGGSGATGGTLYDSAGVTPPPAIYSFGVFIGATPGASSPYGAGGGNVIGGAGHAGTGFGAGGSAASANVSTAAQAGGAGSQGACFVSEFD